jgi:hypothetical protein
MGDESTDILTASRIYLHSSIHSILLQSLVYCSGRPLQQVPTCYALVTSHDHVSLTARFQI